QKYVNNRLKQLRKDGTLSKIAKEYLGGDYVPNEKDLVTPKEK
ncbi:TPA: amino acid ABC transporter substrate-binding protein, partial [Streptococcus agalactiae]